MGRKGILNNLVTRHQKRLILLLVVGVIYSLLLGAPNNTLVSSMGEYRILYLL